MKKIIVFIVISIIVSLLLQSEHMFKDKKCRDGYLYYFLDRMCASGDEIGLKIILDQGADPNGLGYENFIDCTKFGLEYANPMCTATFAKHEHIVKLLLQAGANPNMLEWKGVSPLLYAVENNHIRLVKLLLNNGAKIVVKSQYMNPIDLAKEKRFVELQKILEHHLKHIEKKSKKNRK